ncbi:deoxyribodipyrimidine photolyase-related protein [Primorskyibacter sedentarius]|uniref:Deoxyribodipyrimidine photolyase-related protein n=1 Tax=Primorskyibacter sedentarius TaxID=745311 RepID=A0A4V2UND6_9RHOB|nr:cryptochrome/photolyase family protein [Primorskyibacter sedentarius]TCS61531.1 deoxyribodipyrimidine photolyase-related protein [Primorskyibacter sedentarius]
MVKPRLVLVLGDQLSHDLSSIRMAEKGRDAVVMAEVMDEATYVPHHPKKIALVLAAMRKFASALKDDGWTVAYTKLDDEANTGSITGELIRRASEFDADEIIATTPGEWRLIDALNDLPLVVRQLPDDRFVTSPKEFANWAEGRKELRMEWFYRQVRRKTGLLMEEGEPVGGRWNYDSENRKPAPQDTRSPEPLTFEPDAVVTDVLDLVEKRFAENFGELHPFGFATDRKQALAVLDHFISCGLPRFGDYQDAMIAGEPWLWHAIISPYLNIGLLNPIEVCRRAEEAFRAGAAPLNAVEGFIRQIIGWREYVRGIYFLEGPDYTSRNALVHDRPLPALFWGGGTHMRCLGEVVGQTRDHAYAHHIQRLMITGNFALLAGLDPGAVHQWYLSVYADAFEWVEAPNTIGMSQFADGGLVASKPYVSSGNYISKMSDYCSGCHYDVKAKTGERACPFNLLYWHFIERNRERLQNNPRMSVIYRGWDKRDADQRDEILTDATAWLDRMEKGETV